MGSPASLFLLIATAGILVCCLLRDAAVRAAAWRHCLRRHGSPSPQTSLRLWEGAVDLCQDRLRGQRSAYTSSFCFYVSLKNLKCEVCVCVEVATCPSKFIPIHAVVLNWVTAFFFSFLPLPWPICLPNLKRKYCSFLQRYRRSMNLRPFNPIPRSSHTTLFL